MRALLLTGLAALSLAGCSSSNRVAMSYAPAPVLYAVPATDVRVDALAYSYQPTSVRPAAYDNAVIASADVMEPDPWVIESDRAEPLAETESYAEAEVLGGGSCSELVVC